MPQQENNARLWTEATSILRDVDVDQFIEINSNRIENDSASAAALKRSLEIQIRLHLPTLNRAQLQPHHAATSYEIVRLPAMLRAYAMRRAEEDAQLRANSSLLFRPRKVRRDLVVELEDGREVKLHFSPVRPHVGNAIQKDLHYLRSPRGDTHRQFGIFLPGADHPITYIAFSPCDRSYMASCLRSRDFESSAETTLVLTRMYTLPNMPRNLISMTIKHAVQAIRAERRYSTILTAFNPLLGFTGSAFHASGFQPFAVAPVTYRYRANGEYCTRRQGGRPQLQALDTPPNVLTAKGVTRPVQRALLYCGAMTSVDPDEYHAPWPLEAADVNSSSMLSYEDLMLLRKQLEEAWSERTIHPSYLPDLLEGPKSRGQCGVSSVYLLKELRRRGATNASYCYGDVEFDDESKSSIRHHCWVEYGLPDDKKRHVVDITSDQSDDLGRRVVSEPLLALLKNGVKYRASSRLSLDELPEDRVWPRFLALEEAMNSWDSNRAQKYDDSSF